MEYSYSEKNPNNYHTYRPVSPQVQIENPQGEKQGCCHFTNQFYLMTSFAGTLSCVIIFQVRLFEKKYSSQTKNFSIKPHTPVAQKVADEVVFRRFLGEGVEFF